MGLISIQDCESAKGHGDVFKAAMGQNRYAAEEECETGRETLLDQLEQTYVANYLAVFKGLPFSNILYNFYLIRVCK